MSGTAGVISFYRGEDPLRADKLNAAFAERVLVGGDTMQGFLTLNADPVDPMHAATKGYIDQQVITAVGGSYLPLAGGTVTGPLNVVGTLTLGGTINAASLPTSSAGLVTGDIWSNGGVLCVV